jgi:putative nucleotidyltransferase with HDIG domain
MGSTLSNALFCRCKPSHTIATMDVFRWAATESRRLLVGNPDRWLHVQGVARLASKVAPVLGNADGRMLVAAAFLHDVGYSENLRMTGAHQLDGARYLRSLGLDLERLACLVAHHSEAGFEIAARGLTAELPTSARLRPFLMP